jgi:hypothetical protein
MKNVTVRQFISRATMRYRARYRKTLSSEPYQRPEYAIPHNDHAFGIGPYLISRPYRQDKDYIRDMLDWCDKYELECFIDAPSSWYPATLLVEIFQPEWEKTFWEEAEAKGDAFSRGIAEIIYDETHCNLDNVYRGSSRYPQQTGVYVLDNLRSRHGVNIKPSKTLGVDRYLKAQKHYSIGRKE